MFGMTKVLQFINEVGTGVKGYSIHMSFIASKAAMNLYATDALIKYEIAVTDKVISGNLSDWAAVDPESACKTPRKRQKTSKPGQSANTGIFPFPTLDSGEMACKSPRNRVWCNSFQG